MRPKQTYPGELPAPPPSFPTDAPFCDDCGADHGHARSSLLEAPETTSLLQPDDPGRSITDHAMLSVGFRHSGWKHDRQRIYRSLERTHQSLSRQEAFVACGAHSYVLRNVDDPSRHRVAGSACHDRYCLPCATERACIIANNVQELIEKKEVRFLTLTVRTIGLDLPQSLDKLYRAFQVLRRRSIWTNNVTGGVAFLELTWSDKSKSWHPHFHCLIEGRWLDQKDLARNWLEVTGDSYVVDIRRPGSNSTVARYVTKYASKPFNTTFLRDRVLLDQAVVACKGRKLVICFGAWAGKLLTAPPIDGTWEHVAPLEVILQQAAHGDVDARAILKSLTDLDLSDLYARAPPRYTRPKKFEVSDLQLSFFGTWQEDGSWKTQYDDRRVGS